MNEFHSILKTVAPTNPPPPNISSSHRPFFVWLLKAGNFSIQKLGLKKLKIENIIHPSLAFFA